MMKKITLPIVSSFLFSLALLTAGDAFAQEDSKNIAGDKPLPSAFDGMSIGLNGGWALFHGDVARYDIHPGLNEWRESVSFAWSANFAKHFDKLGVGAELQFNKGNLRGSRGQLLDPKSQYVFDGNYQDLTINANVDLTRFASLQEKRFKFMFQIGVGLIWYRAQHIQVNSGIRRGWVGYRGTVGTEGQVLLEKDTPGRSLVVPVGGSFIYRLNYRTDFTFQLSLRNTYTDELDSWVRDWSSYDKYSYFGYGIRYNFNRSKADDKVVKTEKKDKGKKTSLSVGGLGGAATPGGGSKGGWFSGGKRKANNNSNRGETDDMLELRLKLFETQLKLFEMQYLLHK